MRYWEFDLPKLREILEAPRHETQATFVNDLFFDRPSIAMKILALSLAIAFLAVCAAQGQEAPQARVFRAGMEDNGNRWFLGVNTNSPHMFASSRELYNYITQLRLQHGDLIVFKEMPDKDQIDGFFAPLANYCVSNRVALYLFGGRGEYSLSELFSVPIYHWTSPFNDPRTLSAATFFDDGRFLGVGEDGFDKMVRSIAKKKIPRILILGSLYNQDLQFGPNETPYENQEETLDRVLKKNGTELVFPGQFP